MALNLASINAKLKKYEMSKSGQKAISKKIDFYRENNNSRTAAGSEILTKKKMEDLAVEFIVFLQMKAQMHAQTHAGDGGIPTSVLNHFYNLHYEGPTENEYGEYVVKIFFDDDLSRQSLDDGTWHRTGDGVFNIVALFNNGVDASNYVYGWWEGHTPIGSDSPYRSGYGSKDAWVRSKKEREALRFVQDAISEFNIKYKKRFGIDIDPGIYTGHPGGYGKIT